MITGKDVLSMTYPQGLSLIEMVDIARLSASAVAEQTANLRLLVACASVEYLRFERVLEQPSWELSQVLKGMREGSRSDAAFRRLPPSMPALESKPASTEADCLHVQTHACNALSDKPTCHEIDDLLRSCREARERSAQAVSRAKTLGLDFEARMQESKPPRQDAPAI